jgi:predicted amidohydrolase
VRIAVGQFMACANVAENQKVIERLAGEAAESTAEIIVLPEASMRFLGPQQTAFRTSQSRLKGRSSLTLRAWLSGIR